jgi:FixJ family two-component response regulator
MDSTLLIHHLQFAFTIARCALTPREREVMPLLVAGRLNKQVTADWGPSDITLQLRRGQVMHQRRAASCAALVQMAATLGLPTTREEATSTKGS